MCAHLIKVLYHHSTQCSNLTVSIEISAPSDRAAAAIDAETRPIPPST